MSILFVSMSYAFTPKLAESQASVHWHGVGFRVIQKTPHSRDWKWYAYNGYTPHDPGPNASTDLKKIYI